MFGKNRSEDKCYECKNKIGKERPILSLITERGMIFLCHSCKIKLEEVTAKDKDDRLLLRECEYCNTLTAEDYHSCGVMGKPDIEFWLCSPCYKTWEEKEKETIGES